MATTDSRIFDRYGRFEMGLKLFRTLRLALGFMRIAAVLSDSGTMPEERDELMM